MILFHSDWDLYPTACIHKETRNESFLEMAQVYKAMGVRNHAFMLSLLQPELRHVNPFDENLSAEIKNKIAIECRFNPWYYFREIVRFSAGATPRPFKANRANLSLVWSFYNHIDYMLIQPRQTGKSGSSDTISINLMYFTMYKGKIYLITKDDALRRSNIDRLKEIRDLLPSFLWVKDRADADNQSELTYNLLGNAYLTGVAQKTESGALNLGRGSTCQVTHIDEVPFCSNIDITIPAALAAGTAARQFARENDQPYSNIFTTTAGKKDTREGKYVYDMLADAAVFDESFYDLANQEELRSVLIKRIGKKGARIMINGTWSYRQLGLDEEWLRDALQNSGAKGEEADRDFFNRWTSGSLRSPLSTELNNLIRNSEMDPLWTEYHNDGYSIGWYIPKDRHEAFMQGGHFTLGMDTSEAIGRDAIGLVFSDIRDMATIGAGRCNETNLIKFADYVAELLIKYPNVTLNIERKSTAQTIIDTLLLRLPMHGIDPFKRMFNWVVEEMHTDKNYAAMVNTPLRARGSYFYDDIRSKFGFVTTADSRITLFQEILPEAAKRAGKYCRDKLLVGEITSLVVKNGRIDHKASGHDDMVISWLLGFWLVMKASNLTHYGIPRGAIMSRSIGEGATPEERRRALELELQQQYRTELDVLVDELKNTTNMYVVSKLEHKLNVLNTRIKAMGGESFSLNELLEDIKDARSKSVRMRRL
jgi:hypothetical protein